jgi:hypothetical protein
VAIPYIQQQQQPVKATKPASYLRPWFVDDSSTYNTPVRAAAATKPWSTKVYILIKSLVLIFKIRKRILVVVSYILLGSCCR